MNAHWPIFRFAIRNHCIQAGLAAMVLAAALSAASAGENVGPGYPLRPNQTVVATHAPAPAATSLPATQTFENQPFIFREQAGRPSRSTTGSGGYGLPSILSLLFYVIVFGGMFCAFLYLVKKYLPGHRQLFSHPALEVLGRTHIDQRRYVSLLRVGKRIVVVGVSPDEMRSLSEITDEEEITAIMEVARPKTEAGLTIFQRMFKRTVLDAESAEARAEAMEKALDIEEQTSALREKVRAIRERESPASRVDAIG